MNDPLRSAPPTVGVDKLATDPEAIGKGLTGLERGSVVYRTAVALETDSDDKLGTGLGPLATNSS